MIPTPDVMRRLQCAVKGTANTLAFEVIAEQEFHRAEPVIFVLLVRFNVVLSVHTFSLVESPFTRIRGRRLAVRASARRLDPSCAVWH